MRTSKSLFTLGIALLLVLGGVARSGDVGARAGFKNIQKVAGGDDLGALAEVMPSTVVPDRKDVDAWRTEFADRLSSATFISVREEAAAAVVRMKLPASGDEFELPLSNTDNRWVVAARDAYLVKGRRLKKANGAKQAKVELAMRTRSTKGYGACAFSFAHATKDPNACKNRVDLWFCHNGDLHGSGDTRFVTESVRSVKGVKGIPLGSGWQSKVPATKGQVYVAHCRRDGHRDFYVAFKVAKVGKTSITLEWRVLAAGLGSPPSIHTENPLVSNDGADGSDGLCGKSGQSGGRRTGR